MKVTRRARLAPTDTVAVFGAGGGLGVHMAMVARWARAKKVIAVDTMASKFETCLKAGADATVDASEGGVVEQLMELTGGRGVDVAIDFVSSTSTLEAGAGALAKGGRLVTLGGHGQHCTSALRPGTSKMALPSKPSIMPWPRRIMRESLFWWSTQLTH